MERTIRGGDVMKIVAITCARMDSKRFPGKCLAMLDGKPLLQHTIDFARSIDIPLYTFTRDQRIIDYVKDKTPIIYEPIELYDTPQNTTYEKMQYVNRILDADYVILLQPTQPVRWEMQFNLNITLFSRQEKYNYGYYVNHQSKEPDGSLYIYSKDYLNGQDKNEFKLRHFSEEIIFDIDTPEDLKECEEWLQKQAIKE
jgi:CMP-N-acetylneuraminic acid synthetase